MLLLLCSWPQLAPADATMDIEIEHLLATVEQSDCTFIRNGKEYAGDDARDHLAMKRRRGKRHFDSADDFIERIASKSSWSGKLYQIRCDDTPAEPSGDWFRKALAEFRSSQ